MGSEDREAEAEDWLGLVVGSAPKSGCQPHRPNFNLGFWLRFCGWFCGGVLWLVLWWGFVVGFCGGVLWWGFVVGFCGGVLWRGFVAGFSNVQPQVKVLARDLQTDGPAL